MWLKMYLLFVKRAEFSKGKVYVKYIKYIYIKLTKACIVYNNLLMLKFKFAAERGEHALA